MASPVLHGVVGTLLSSSTESCAVSEPQPAGDEWRQLALPGCSESAQRHPARTSDRRLCLACARAQSRLAAVSASICTRARYLIAPCRCMLPTPTPTHIPHAPRAILRQGRMSCGCASRGRHAAPCLRGVSYLDTGFVAAGSPSPGRQHAGASRHCCSGRRWRFCNAAGHAAKDAILQHPRSPSCR